MSQDLQSFSQISSQPITRDVSDSGAILFIDGDGNWLVGSTSSAVKSYVEIHTATDDNVTDATFGLTAQSVTKAETGGYILYLEDMQDGEFYTVVVNSDRGTILTRYFIRSVGADGNI